MGGGRCKIDSEELELQVILVIYSDNRQNICNQVYWKIYSSSLNNIT